MINFSFFKKKKEQSFSGIVLDVGTESVKVLLFEKEAFRIKILKTSLEHFDYYGIFNSKDFNKEVLKKTISKAIENLGDIKNKYITLGLPPTILKSKITCYNLKREKFKNIINETEQENIFKRIFEEAKKNTLENYIKEFGILPEEIEFLNLKTLEIKIDGYKVDSLLKYRGRDLEFKVLVTFSPKYYLKEIKSIINSLNLRIKNIKHQAEGLDIFRNKISEGILLDIGGMITQIYLIKNYILEKNEEVSFGGNIFSKAIAERLGLNELDAKSLKEKYSRGELSPDSLARIKDILAPACQIWFEKLKNKLLIMTEESILPPNIFIFGGGSLLPDVKNILKNGNWDNIFENERPEVNFLFPEEEVARDIKLKKINNPQETPLILLAYAKKGY